MLGPSPSHAVIWVAALALITSPPHPVPGVADVSGRVTIVERGNKPGTDVGRAVLWLEAAGAKAPAPKTSSVFTEGKEFRPRVSVVQVGSTVVFPNNDPFNHNVFSLSEEGQFDLGLYGRGQSKSMKFTKPGVIRIYCNVHATMAAFILVRDNSYYAQPSGDGTFAISGVPPGRYVLHGWHERAPAISREVEVGPQGVSGLDLQLDGRSYKFVQHLNKFGQPYSRGGARY
jgi:plastocyanin